MLVLHTVASDCLMTVSKMTYDESLFTSYNVEATTCPEVQLAGVDVPLECNPKILGVVHDTNYTFSQHCKNMRDKVQKRVNVLKALAGTDNRKKHWL